MGDSAEATNRTPEVREPVTEADVVADARTWLERLPADADCGDVASTDAGWALRADFTDERAGRDSSITAE